MWPCAHRRARTWPALTPVGLTVAATSAGRSAWKGAPAHRVRFWTRGLTSASPGEGPVWNLGAVGGRLGPALHSWAEPLLPLSLLTSIRPCWERQAAPSAETVLRPLSFLQNRLNQSHGASLSPQLSSSSNIRVYLSLPGTS